MILFDEADSQIAVEVLRADDADATGADGPSREQAARAEVEEWLSAVARCFGLPDGCRWLDY